MFARVLMHGKSSVTCSRSLVGSTVVMVPLEMSLMNGRQATVTAEKSLCLSIPTRPSFLQKVTRGHLQSKISLITYNYFMTLMIFQ